jgi:hypothetical protein
MTVKKAMSACGRCDRRFDLRGISFQLVRVIKNAHRLEASPLKVIFRHYSLIATLVERLYSDYCFSFLAFHPVFKLQQDVTDDRAAAAPFVSNFFQVAKHSIATLNMIVRTDLATNRNGMLKVVEEPDHVVLLENLKCFDQMLVAAVRWVASDSSPDFPGLSLAAADCKEFMQVVHEQSKIPKRW